MFELPAAKGGKLETVAQIVTDTISNLISAGQSVGSANYYLSLANSLYSAGRYKKSYYYYAYAYRSATTPWSENAKGIDRTATRTRQPDLNTGHKKSRTIKLSGETICLSPLSLLRDVPLEGGFPSRAEERNASTRPGAGRRALARPDKAGCHPLPFRGESAVRGNLSVPPHPFESGGLGTRTGEVLPVGALTDARADRRSPSRRRCTW